MYMDIIYLITRLKAILSEYGDLSAERYDGLKIDDKPSRRTICRQLGEWATAKSIAMQYTGDAEMLA